MKNTQYILREAAHFSEIFLLGKSRTKPHTHIDTSAHMNIKICVCKERLFCLNEYGMICDGLRITNIIIAKY